MCCMRIGSFGSSFESFSSKFFYLSNNFVIFYVIVSFLYMVFAKDFCFRELFGHLSIGGNPLCAEASARDISAFEPFLSSRPFPLKSQSR